jgi:DNA-binding CsgD family transcriptional regulator
MGDSVFLVVQLLVLCLASSAATISGLIGQRRKNPAAWWFAALTGGVALMMVDNVALWALASIRGGDAWDIGLPDRAPPAIAFAMGYTLLIAGSQRFAAAMAGTRTYLTGRIVLWASSLAASGLGTAYVVLPRAGWVGAGILLLALAVLVGSAIRLIVSGSPGFDATSRRLALSALGLVVFGVGGFVALSLLHASFPFDKMYLFDAFVLGIIVLMTRAMIRSLDHPAYVEAGKTSAFFTQKHGITSREAEIADLVLGGLDNKAIAEHLGLSPRTVENHLHSVYQKTGVNSRLMLFRMLTSAGPGGSQSGAV